jgi:hypothetical protein
MQTLKLTTVTVHEVGYTDLEVFVQAQYPGAREYSFVADQECGNDSDHTFSVEAAPLDAYDRGRVDEFAAGKHRSYLTGAILNDLCHRGLIPAGTYLVKVCW